MSQKAVRVPLTLEHVVGAQKGMLKFPSILTTPDKNVFLSMYPQPEFIFRHQAGRRFVPEKITIWSRVQHESQGGFPIGKGLIFISDSLAELQH
jgi:hypothetical protein